MCAKRMYFLLFITLLFIPTESTAHSLWININESYAHSPGHAISSIGWGHAFPMDDFVNNIALQSYALFAPDHAKTDLSLPVLKEEDVNKIDSGIEVRTGDFGVQKFTLSKESKPGTYQVVLESKENYYTKYINEDGKEKWEFTSMDKVKNAQKILGGMKYKAYAKSYFTVQEWDAPKSLGHDLEITPENDLSNVHVGDKINFTVTFMGKPLNTQPEQSFEYISAVSNTFGGPDGFSLAAVLFNGKGSFRIPTAGQWMVNVYTRQTVTPENDLKHLAKKCTAAVYSSTLTFNVKP